VRWGNISVLIKEREQEKEMQESMYEEKGEKRKRARELIPSEAGLASRDKTSHNAAQS
jgi:hypothetical protein